MVTAAARRQKRKRKDRGMNEEEGPTVLCSGLVRERFRTTRDRTKANVVADFRGKICGKGPELDLWVRAERPNETRVRPNMMRVKSIWRRREREPGLYMSPASVKDVMSDVRPFYPEELKGDVLIDHDGFLRGEGKDPCNLEFLVGARGSTSEFHRDGGLLCWVTLEVIEGKKRVAVMPRNWLWGEGDGELDWSGIQRLCEEVGGYSTVLGPGEALTFWSDAPHAALNEEPTLSLSFAWLEEEHLLRCLRETFRRELEEKSASWVPTRLAALIQWGVSRAFTRYQMEGEAGQGDLLLEVHRLYKACEECRARKALLTKRDWGRVLSTFRLGFFRKL